MVKSVLPTVFHATHWKAGSQWVAEILKYSAPDRFVSWQETGAKTAYDSNLVGAIQRPFIPGKIYGTVYLNKDVFDSIIAGSFWGQSGNILTHPRRVLHNFWNYRLLQNRRIVFSLIRDLRDTLVSFYYSDLYSHSLMNDAQAGDRDNLQKMTEEDGLIYLMNRKLFLAAAVQASWLNASNVLHLRYENILGREYTFFEELIDYCEIKIERERLHEIVRYNVFETATGRKPGQEDPKAHLRKGIAGDWQNHFTDRVKQEFKARYGDILIKTGYAKDLSW